MMVDPQLRDFGDHFADAVRYTAAIHDERLWTSNGADGISFTSPQRYEWNPESTSYSPVDEFSDVTEEEPYPSDETFGEFMERKHGVIRE